MDYRGKVEKGVGGEMEELDMEVWKWSWDDLVMSWVLVGMVRSLPVQISLLLTKLHLDKAIKSLSKCN